MKRLENVFMGIRQCPALWLVLLFGFAIRLFWILWSPHAFPAAITEDEIIWRHATELAGGYGFRNASGEFTAMRPVGYPLFLSLLIRVFGSNVFIGELAQLLTSVLCIYLIYLIGAQLHSKPFGLTVALVFASYPTAIYSTKVIMDEHLFILLWLTGLYYLISDYQRPSMWKIMLAGLAIGLSAVTRTYAVLSVPVAFLVWLLAKRNIRQAFVCSVCLTAIIIVCAAPWAIRNYLKLGVPIPYTTLLGIHLYWANNDASGIRYPINPAPEQGGDLDFVDPKSEYEKDIAGRKAAFQWIAKNPALFVQKSLGRTFYMLGLNREDWTIYDNFHTIKKGRRTPSEKLRKILTKIEQYYYVFIFCFGLVGFVFLFKAWQKGGDPSGFTYVIFTIVIYIMATSIELNFRKYRFPIEVFLMYPAVYALLRAFFSSAFDRSAQAQSSTSGIQYPDRSNQTPKSSISP